MTKDELTTLFLLVAFIVLCIIFGTDKPIP
jgi:hypothetical protein